MAKWVRNAHFSRNSNRGAKCWTLPRISDDHVSHYPLLETQPRPMNTCGMPATAYDDCESAIVGFISHRPSYYSCERKRAEHPRTSLFVVVKPSAARGDGPLYHCTRQRSVRCFARYLNVSVSFPSCPENWSSPLLRSRKGIRDVFEKCGVLLAIFSAVTAKLVRLIGILKWANYARDGFQPTVPRFSFTDFIIPSSMQDLLKATTKIYSYACRMALRWNCGAARGMRTRNGRRKQS